MAAYGLPAFPGAEGFGSDTVHGSGRHLGTPNTTVYKVTNLNDSGAGSFRACAEASGPRVCIFETSGVITLTSGFINVNQDYLTVAGQTAPSPGIAIQGGGANIKIFADNVLIQHIRVRPGDDPPTGCGDRDAFTVGNGGNIVLDHVTAMWGTDETMTIYANPGQYLTNITVSNSIIAEPLRNACGGSGADGFGFLGGRAGNISFIRNILAHVKQRNPTWRSGTDSVSSPSTMTTTNSLIYNPGEFCVHRMYVGTKPDASEEAAGVVAVPYTLSYVGNHMIPGLDSGARQTVVCVEGSGNIVAGTEVHVDDNLSPWSTSDPYAVVEERQSGCGGCLSKPPAANPVTYANQTILPSADVYDYVFANAGARPTDRDATDDRILTDIAQGTGVFKECIDPGTCANNVGGYPTLAVNTRTLTVPSNPNEVQPSGYTRLEEWLHTFYADVEPQPPTSAAAALRNGAWRNGRLR